MVYGNLLRVSILVQRGELDEGAVGQCALPSVVADDEPVNIEEEVVVRLLQGLCDGVEFAFV